MSSADASLCEPIEFVYDLPYRITWKLSSCLDENCKWKELGGRFLKFDRYVIHQCEREFFGGRSPTEFLLRECALKDIKVLKLFNYLHKMGLARPMRILKRYVDPRYHYMIEELDRSALSTCNESAATSTNNKNCSFPANSNGDALSTIFMSQGRDEGASENTRLVFPPSVSPDEVEFGNRHVLGRGAFGEVFKARYENRIVAVKVIKPLANKNHRNLHWRTFESFMREMRFLSGHKHPNILPLLGYTTDGEYPALICQFMPNGSLANRLHSKGYSALTWRQRVTIAHGMADGLKFLHTFNPTVLHVDFKSDNVLLDDELVPKIADFGLAKEFSPVTDLSYVIVNKVEGTRAYWPLEYRRSGKLSIKVDTYGFGTVLFELATGRKAFDESENSSLLRDYCHEALENGKLPPSLKDANAGHGPDSMSCYEQLSDLAVQCTTYPDWQRPDMVDVFNQLNSFINNCNFRTKRSGGDETSSVSALA